MDEVSQPQADISIEHCQTSSMSTECKNLAPAIIEEILSGKNADENENEISKLVLSKHDLVNDDFPSDFQLPLHFQHADLSRNLLRELPTCICQLENLITLDVSRNSLRSLPPEICQLTNLQELHALSNNLRSRKLPIAELVSMSQLRLLDLRFNSKLKQAAMDSLKEAFTSRPNNNDDACPVEIRCTVPDLSLVTNKLSAADRDATLLRSQLEPLSTPQLRKRLDRTFGISFSDDDERVYDREFVMTELLQAYERHGPRKVRLEQGIPVRQERLDALYRELEAINWPQTTRERPKIRAQYYMILQKPGSGQLDSVRTQRETAKLEKHRSLFDLAVDTITEVDPEFAEQFTALAVTKNFTGSPHIDTLNVGPFYGMALGDFESGGGKIAVECAPLIVAEINTRGKLGKVDGRFPHWVTPYDESTATRYSLIYYQTSGEVSSQTTAIFSPSNGLDMDGNLWIPPPVYEP